MVAEKRGRRQPTMLFQRPPSTRRFWVVETEAVGGGVVETLRKEVNNPSRLSECRVKESECAREDMWMSRDFSLRK